MTNYNLLTYSDSGRQTVDLENADSDTILGVGDYTEFGQRPDRERGDVLSVPQARGLLESEFVELSGQDADVYLVPGNQDGGNQHFGEVVQLYEGVSPAAYTKVDLNEDLALVAGGPNAGPEVPPRLSGTNAQGFMTLKDLGFIDERTASKGAQYNARKIEVDELFSEVRGDDQEAIFAHHNAPFGKDLEDYDLDLVPGVGHRGSLLSRYVLEQHTDALSAVIGGHIEEGRGREEVNGVPVYNVARSLVDLEFEEEEVVGEQFHDTW